MNRTISIVAEDKVLYILGYQWEKGCFSNLVSVSVVIPDSEVLSGVNTLDNMSFVIGRGIVTWDTAREFFFLVVTMYRAK